MAYDLIVIGTGPGGYVCAIKAAQLGLKTAVVEKRDTFGGTCLNIGCIPSKALLYASEEFHKAGHEFGQLGIKLGTPELDLPAMMAHKDQTVKANVDGVQFLFKKNKIDAFHGTGRIAGEGTVVVTGEDGSEQTVEAKAIVIATGSDVAGIPGVEVDIDEEVIVSSTGGIALKEVPGRMIVVGGGVIGLELGSVWSRLGAEVTVIEYLPKILGPMDGDVSRQFQKLLKKQGISIETDAKVTAVERRGQVAAVTYEPVRWGRRDDDRGRCRADLDGPAALYGCARAARGWYRDRPWTRRHRRSFPHQCRRRLCHWRRGAGTDAGAQGRRRGNRRR